MNTSATPTASPREKYLDPAMLMQLGGLLIRARSVVEGAIAGMHRSPHRGSSVEFAEYKEYTPGDEIKHIDWKAFGRFDKYYVKQFEDETNLGCYLMLDGSGSMDFGSEEVTKLDYARTLAASFGYFLLRQGDAVGALVFDDQPGVFLPPSSKNRHLDDVLAVLDSIPGTGRTDIARALSSMAERVRRRGIMMIFSDMLDDAERVMNIAKVMRKRKQEVVVFHILDPAELELPYEGLTIFEGLEGEGELLVDPDDVRDQYAKEMAAHVAAIERQCLDGDIEYFRVLTTTPLERILLDFIAGRL